jgi:hypothetical protein
VSTDGYFFFLPAVFLTFFFDAAFFFPAALVFTLALFLFAIGRPQHHMVFFDIPAELTTISLPQGAQISFSPVLNLPGMINPSVF